ncbi:MAG: hypothetical protein A2Y03_06660 [Omnitrophica WOR_2 bacterium GWF2_38_59]|nr:MAG: hypothetical protein A2Y03_06660 [Omnitrophica WOR_2 bacterium GWF2_38_59]OGX50468.1 MAG: hypothetical protein A2243_01915 [Omnitrophica WOR_2 bacterium RIFOXYA2_FULL_38_17]OGX54538.1 MAG: hypothetical protein A2267_04595 [Omnitrophica WOR_2 bacterium RIFOXYA12_FULL_38_10]OGX59477.1 MAG: hypothetical protein A2306_09540 [Omnitrophica WOR_2 bacterium RIFOXYB2_FULL_38_16]HBG62057.1 hypothetical protein [Candidatus Omnitrophota bacterium]
MNRIDELASFSITELEELFQKLLGKTSSSNNRLYLSRNIAYKLQEKESDGFPKKLAESIQQLIKELDPINMTILRSSRPLSKKLQTRDQRLPIPGTTITKKYKDQLIEVKVLEKGFEYKGKYYKTLTSISEEITSSHWSGFNFFNLE